MKKTDTKIFNTWIDKINNTIQSFITTINKEYKCEMGTDFCVYMDTNIINWSIFYADENGTNFYNDFVKRFPVAKDLDLFTLSILHEVGHLETEEDMEDDTKIDTDSLTDEEYFNLHNEKIATNWAGEWIEKNHNKAKQINDTFMNILIDGYGMLLTE